MRYLALIIVWLNLSGSAIAQNWDIDLLKNINLNRNPNLDEIFKGITNSAAPMAYGVPLVIMAAGFLKKDSTLKRNGIYFGTSILASATISSILKYSVNRPRPFETYPSIQNVGEGGSPSFPSGHTTDAFALATSISIAYPKWYVIIPSYTWACVVGYSRMDLGVHYPSDVLAGAIIGAGSSYLCYKINKRLAKRHR